MMNDDLFEHIRTLFKSNILALYEKCNHDFDLMIASINLVFKKYDRYSFFALPLSTKNKTGSWYASITFGGINQVVVS
jgi:hypothetical protein